MQATTDILIVEDDSSFSLLLQSFLEKQGFGITVAEDVATAGQLLNKNTYQLLLLDYRLPDGTGMDILDMLRDKQMQLPVIIMTSFHDIRTAVKTIRSGASDYITKPVNPDELLLSVQSALKKKTQPQEAVTQPASQTVEGRGMASQKLYEHIQLVGPTDFSVIIQGDSGTGKELAARKIHNLSKRKTAPFVALDCGALSADLAGSELFGHVKGAFTGALHNKKGLFEEASEGTVFLDEVGNLGYEIQVKLLRALQEREIQPIGSNLQIPVNVRIISATNENLLNAVKTGKFREDLYHRLNEFTIHIPPLQQRQDDLPEFIQYFIDQTNAELGKEVKGVSKEVMDIFTQYDWPGNLRELKNIIKRAVLLTNGYEINLESLPPEMQHTVQHSNVPVGFDLKSMQALSEKELIIKTLELTRYNKTKAARLLKIDRATLYYKMSKYHIGQ